MPEHEREDIHRRILESLQTGVCLVNQKHKVRFWNEGAEKATGHLRQDVLGHEVRYAPARAQESIRSLQSQDFGDCEIPGPTTGRERREIWRGRRRHVTSGRQRTFEFARKSRAE